MIKTFCYTISITLKSKSIQKARVNHQIQAPQVRVVQENGPVLGIMSLSEAFKKAEELGLDLVEIAPQAEPPVVKLINFDKFRYQQKKALDLQKKHAQKVEVKGARLSMRISEHDLAIKAQKSSEFLKEGHKLKIDLVMRGREQAHVNLAHQVLQKFLGLLKEPHIVETPAKKLGHTLTMLVAKKK